MTLKNVILRSSVYFFCGFFWLASCGIFTFQGAEPPPEIKSFSIQEFYSEVADAPPDMNQKLMEALETKLLQMTSLTREDKDGDIQYDGIITSFAYSTVWKDDKENPNSIPKEVKCLTIKVNVTYTNPFEEENEFNKESFEGHAYMDTNDDQSTKEEELINTIIRDLVDKIYTKSIDAW
ncbi:LPS assembly lipoprotein LptE [Candidatus Cardinium hertigii]|uniref:Uncharacterized protein n=1 Tax=Candidatus Cardinium hertigii TaxID=247481 RepID=A0A3N2QBD1_9BACT|nr:LPS assembly lipoprotein LptE [Candidatus Cardinium hertigii]ROT47128.1 hypothetical protein EDM02_04565 [Candidatus Cardinium hertigii]